MIDSAENEIKRTGHREHCIACREPIHQAAKICPHCRSTQSVVRWKFLGTALKWIGGATALISLVAGAIQLTGLLQTARERTAAVQTLVRAADIQIEIGDLAGAMQLVEQALVLQPGSRDAGERQVTTAMMMVRRYYAVSVKPREHKLGPLMPILHRGAGDSDPIKAANVLAHIGWANYLLSPERGAELPVVDYFQRAIELDDDNAFAHVFWGNWCLSPSSRDRPKCGNNLETARSHYKIALQDRRHHDYVRALSLFWLRVTRVEGSQMARFENIISIWRNKEPLEPKKKRALLAEFKGFCPVDEATRKNLQTLLNRFPAGEVLGALRWLSAGQKLDRSYTTQKVLMANLTELAGYRLSALGLYRTLRTELRWEELVDRQTFFSSIRERVDWSIAKLLDIRPGSLGISFLEITDDFAQTNGIPGAQGVFVSEVIPGGPAEQGGILTGDVILEIEDEVAQIELVEQILGARFADDILTLTVLRAGERHSFRVTLGEKTAPTVIDKPDFRRSMITRPIARLIDHALYRPIAFDVTGHSLRIVSLSDELRTAFKVAKDAKGVLVFDAHPGKRKSDLRAGDLILEINHLPVRSAEEAIRAIEDAKISGETPLLFQRFRSGSHQTVAIKIN